MNSGFSEPAFPVLTAALFARYPTAAAYAAADPTELADTDRMRLFVFGSADGTRANLVALLDNLGKGASGAAVQNMDLMLGR